MGEGKKVGSQILEIIGFLKKVHFAEAGGSETALLSSGGNVAPQADLMRSGRRFPMGTSQTTKGSNARAAQGGLISFEICIEHEGDTLKGVATRSVRGRAENKNGEREHRGHDDFYR